MDGFNTGKLLDGAWAVYQNVQIQKNPSISVPAKLSKTVIKEKLTGKIECKNQV